MNKTEETTHPKQESPVPEDQSTTINVDKITHYTIVNTTIQDDSLTETKTQLLNKIDNNFF